LFIFKPLSLYHSENWIDDDWKGRQNVSDHDCRADIDDDGSAGIKGLDGIQNGGNSAKIISVDVIANDTDRCVQKKCTTVSCNDGLWPFFFVFHLHEDVGKDCSGAKSESEDIECIGKGTNIQKAM